MNKWKCFVSSLESEWKQRLGGIQETMICIHFNYNEINTSSKQFNIASTTMEYVIRNLLVVQDEDIITPKQIPNLTKERITYDNTSRVGAEKVSLAVQGKVTRG